MFCRAVNINNAAPDRKFTKFTHCLGAEKSVCCQKINYLLLGNLHLFCQAQGCPIKKGRMRDFLKPAIYCGNKQNGLFVWCAFSVMKRYQSGQTRNAPRYNIRMRRYPVIGQTVPCRQRKHLYLRGNKFKRAD